MKSGQKFKGGVTSYNKVKREIFRLLGDTSASLVTTMIDYYALPNTFPGRAIAQGLTPLERVRFVEEALSNDINHYKFFPYLSLHEFEALLFVSPSVIAGILARSDLQPQLEAIRAAFLTPEDINDNPMTAPSARLKSMYQSYSKPYHGYLIASQISIQEMRDECIHFNYWLTHLEQVGGAGSQ